MIRLTGLLRPPCEYSPQLPLVLVQDYTDDMLRKSTAMLEAHLKALKESICNVQLLHTALARPGASSHSELLFGLDDQRP